MQTWLDKYKENLLCHLPHSHFKLEAFASEEEANKVRQEITELVKKTSTTELTHDNQDGTKSLSFVFKRQPLQTISPQSSETTAYLAELTLEESNDTLQFQKTAA